MLALALGVVVGRGGTLARAALTGQTVRTREATAIQTMKEIIAAEVKFRENGLSGDGLLRYGSLAEIVSAGLVSRDLPSGYVFHAVPSAATSEFLWCAVAEPSAATDRSLVTNHAGAIWVMDGRVNVDATWFNLPPYEPWRSYQPVERPCFKSEMGTYIWNRPVEGGLWDR